MLISRRFYYFGALAPLVPHHILTQLGYRNQIGHRKFPLVGAQPLLDWIEAKYRRQTNTVIGDPYQFMESGARYSKRMDKILD